MISHVFSGAQSRAGSVLKCAAVVFLILNLYSRVLLEMAHQWWTQPAQSQGILIPPLAICVAWLLRGNLRVQPVVPDRSGYALSALAGLLLFAGAVAADYFLARISFIVLLAGLILTFWGRRRLRTLALPLLLLATMVPLPGLVYNSLAAPLQLLASKIAAALATLAGVAVFQDGNLIHVAGMTLGVAEACSGLNSLSALLVASLLLGFAYRLSPLLNAILLALSVPIAIAANIARVAGSAILADHNPRLAENFYHYFTGWLIFVLGLLILICTGRMLKQFSPGTAA